MRATAWWTILSGVFVLLLAMSTAAEADSAGRDASPHGNGEAVGREALNTSTRAGIWNTSDSIVKNLTGLWEIVNPAKDPKSNYSKVSCDFSRDMCGWQNVGGENYTLTWTRKNCYMHLNMDDADDKKGRLASPWLEPLTSYNCKLGFSYYMRKDDRCQLDVLRETFWGEERLWSTQKGTGFTDFSAVIHLPVNCSAEPFRIVFEGWKSCNLYIYDEIDVRAIQFTVYPKNIEPPTESSPLESPKFTIEQYTGTPDPAHPDTVTTDVPNSQQENGNALRPSTKEQDKERGQIQLNPSLLAGIVIAVVAVIGLVIAVVIVVRRRRSVKSDGNLTTRSTPRTMTNAAYMQANSRPPREEDPENTAPDNSYDLVDIHAPSDMPATPQALKNNGSSDDTPANTYPVVSHRESSPSPPTATTSNQDTYNRLSNASYDEQQQQHPRASCHKNNIRSNSQSPPRPAPKAASKTGPAGDDVDDTYDHTSRERNTAEPVNTYDHTMKAASFPPSVPKKDDGIGGDYYNQVQLKSTQEPVATTGPGEDTYKNTISQSWQQDRQRQPTPDDHTPSRAKVSTDHGHQRNIRKIGDPNSTAGRNDASTAVESFHQATDYEIVDDLGEKVRSTPTS